MLRLFLLSMAFCGCVVFIPLALGPLQDELYYPISSFYTEIIIAIFIIIAGAGTITLGVMLAKHIMGLIKK